MPPLSQTFLLVVVLLTSNAKPALAFSGFEWARTTTISGDVWRVSSSALSEAKTGEPGGGSQLTAELLEVDETKRAREIADSVDRARTAISVATGDDAPLRADAKAAAAVATLDRTKEEVDELKFKIGKIDKDRVKELEAKEAEINRLKFSLMDLKDKAAEGERRVEDADRKIEALQRESEGSKEENKNILSKIRDQFRGEKDDLTEQLRSIGDELRRARVDAGEEAAFVKLASSEREDQLLSQISELESTLEKREGSLAESREEVGTMRERHWEELTNQIREAKRLQEASDRVAGQDKRDLRNKAWEFQSAFDAATYELEQLRKEAEELEGERVALEERLKDVETSAAQQVIDMEEEVKSARYEMASRISAVKDAAEKQMAAMRKATITAIAKGKTEKWEAMDLAEVKYDALVALNQQSLKEAEEKSQERIQSLRDEMEGRLELAKKAAKREKLALKEKQKVEMIVVRNEADQRIKAVKRSLAEVEGNLAQKEVAIDAYEEERKSFRKMARLTWRLARERSSKLRQRVAGKLRRKRT